MEYSYEYLHDLENEFGSPLYIFQKDEFIANYKQFVDSFRKRYSKYILAYSYKTNYAPYICKIVKDLGGYAEVVSEMEYQVAKKIGYEDRHIIYNGPCKGRLAMDMLLNGGKLNVDNLEELKKICEFAKKNQNKHIKIGIRVNINIGQSFVSRFGIDDLNGDLDHAFQMVHEISNLEIVGLHCHVGQSRTVQAWKNRVKKMLQLVNRYFENTPEYIDLGSGMYGRMDEFLANQFGKDLPSFEEYADAVTTLFSEYFANVPDKEKPYLFTEPGTTVINSYVDFVGRVTCIKEVKGKCFAILNCSKHNLGEICTLKQLPVHIYSNSSMERNQYSDVDFVGYTCLEHDVMYKDFSGEINVGDYIIFENVGGYSNVSKPPFILQNCAMISVDRMDKRDIIKRAEMFEDVFNTYEF